MKVSNLSQAIAIASALGASELATAQALPNNTYSPAEVGDMIDRTDPGLGRLAIIEILGDYVVAFPEVPSSPPGHNHIKVYDLSNPSNPQEVADLGLTTHPFLAHGLIKRDNQVYYGSGFGEQAITLNDNGSITIEQWQGPSGHWNKSGMMRPWAARHWWSYGDVSGNAWLSFDGVETAQWDHLGLTGVIGMPIFMGNLMLYASDQSMTGVAAYDVSNPNNPVLLDVLKLPDTHPTLTYGRWQEGVGVTQVPAPYGLGGYWAEVSGNYIVFARRGENPGIQVVDFSDPSNLRMQCEFFTLDPRHDFGSMPFPERSGPMYVGFQDNYVFAEQFKIDIETCDLEQTFDEEGTNNDGSSRFAITSQYSRPIGNLLLTGGGHRKWWWPQHITEGGGMGVWIQDSQPDTNPPYVSYHIPRANQTNYPLFAPISLMIPETIRSETIIPGQTLIVQAVGGNQVPIDYTLSHTGMLTVDTLVDLQPNTTYEVTLTGIQDAVRNPMATYSYRFSTGNSVEGGGGTPPPPPPPPANNPPVINSITRPNGEILQGTNASITANATDADGDALEYRFRINNGNYSNWTSNSSFNHTFNVLGNTSITVQVRDESNATVTQVENFVIVAAVVEVDNNLNASQIAFDNTGHVWTVNPDNNSVTRINAESGSVVGEYAVGDDPRSIAIDSQGNVWVTLFDSDLIEVLNNNGQVIGMIDVGYGSAPTGIVMHPENDEAYVALYGSGEVARINTQNRTITERLSVGPTVKGLAISENGNTLLATRFISGEHWGEIYRINTANFSLGNTIKLHKSLNEESLENGRGLPNYISDVIINSNATRAYAIGKKDNIDRGLLNTNDDLDDDNTVRTLAVVIDLQTGNEITSQQFDFDNADSPSALAFSPSGNHLFVAMQGRNEVFVLGVDEQNGLSLDAQFAVELAPQAVYVDSNNNNLFAKNFMSRSLSIIDINDFLNSGSINPPTQHVTTVSNEILSAEVLRGKQIFYNAALNIQTQGQFTGSMSAEGYMSCATCHIDGGHDGRTYDFTGRGEGLRNNISLKGRGGIRFGNVHWTGNFDEIHDFENDIRNQFGGTGFLSDADFTATENPLGAEKAGLSQDLDNLVAYVSSLNKASLPRSPHRNDNGSLTQSAVRGQTLFQQEGCSNCHRGNAFTDGVIHDVGTYRSYSGQRLSDTFTGLKTPSLLGLFDSAPYLHDGSAKNIRDVFYRAGGTVVQAEDAQHNGEVVTPASNYSYFREGQAVSLTNGETVTASFNSETSGTGVFAFRFTTNQPNAEIAAYVNNNSGATPLTVTPVDQVLGEDVYLYEAYIVLDVPSGNSTFTVSPVNGTNIIVDDITISTPADVLSADAHTKVMALSNSEQDDLVNYLAQIDHTNAPEDNEQIILGEMAPSVTQMFQAEDFTNAEHVQIRTDRSWWSGTGFIDLYRSPDSFVEWNNVSSDSAQTVTLNFRYTNGNNFDRTMTLFVNGVSVGTLSFSPTGDWANVGIDSVTVSLNAGNNTIRIQSANDQGGPDFDGVEVVFTSTEPPEADTGDDSSDDSSDDSGDNSGDNSGDDSSGGEDSGDDSGNDSGDNSGGDDSGSETPPSSDTGTQPPAVEDNVDSDSGGGGSMSAIFLITLLGMGIFRRFSRKDRI